MTGGRRAAILRALRTTGAYAILDGSGLRAGRLGPLALSLRRGGIRVFQLRIKDAPDRAVLDAAARVRRAIGGGCGLLLNDRCDLAVAAGADGVHLGQEDLPVAAARRLLGSGAVIGLSAGTPAEVDRAMRQRPEYLSLGPAFPTRTKRDAGPALGAAGFRRLAARAGRDATVLAVGGIRPDNVGDLIRSGATAVAAASCLAQAGSPERAARRLMEAVRAARLSGIRDTCGIQRGKGGS